MKKINLVLVSLSSVLVANSAAASWSVGGFVGQSNGRSLIDCRGGELPITTLTTSIIEQPLLNQGAIDAALAGTPQGSFLNNDFLDQLQGTPEIVIDPDNGFVVSIESSDAVDLSEITTVTTLVGTPENLGLSTVSTEFVPTFISTDVPVFFIDFGSVGAGGFDLTDLGDFLSGSTSSGTSFGDFFLGAEEDFVATVATSNGALVTQAFEIFECNDDLSDVGYSVNLGYNFTKVWGVEFGYVDLGEFSSELTSANVSISNTPNRELSVSAFYLAGTGTHYYNKKWSITGRLGLYALDIDDRVEGNIIRQVNDDVFGEAPSSDEGVYYGISWNYDFSKQIQFQLRYDDFDVDIFSLGIEYRLRN